MNDKTIHFSPEKAHNFLESFDYLFNLFDKLQEQKGRLPSNYNAFHNTAKPILERLSYLQEVELESLIRLETKIRHLLRSTSLNETITFQLNNILREVNSITSSIKINSITKESNVDLIKKAIKNELKKSENLVNQQLKNIEQRNENILNQTNEIRNDFLSSLNNELNELEQSSIKRMLSQSSKRLEELKKVQDGALRAFNESIQDNIDSISSRIDEEVAKFESRRSDMDKLLEQVGLAKDAEVTINQADKEEKSANKYRKNGIYLLYASIFLLILMFSEYIGLNKLWGGTVKSLSDLTFEAFAIRFMTITLISSPAIYMLKESASHRAKENLYRQRGTQLLTIRGYLSDLPDTHRTEVKKQLAANFFSFHNGKADTSNVPDFIKNMNEAVKLAHAIKTPPTNEPSNRDQTNR